jgi:L-lysine exporter family protein LysE/ArgO
MNPSLTPFIEGFLLNAGLIIGFGPQNAFLLRQSLSRQHLFVMVVLCVCVDAVLMTLGVLGLGRWVSGFGPLTKFITYAGIGFLLYYGLRSFHSVFFHSGFTATSAVANAEGFTGRGKPNVIFTLLVASLVNPFKYLDTLLFVAGTALHFEVALRFVFVTGAIFASLTWFVCLSYGAALLAPWLNHKVALRLLDLSSGSILWFTAYRLWQQTHLCC